MKSLDQSRTYPFPRKDNICAVVVTHHPDNGFPERIKSILEEVGRVTIVDNASNHRSLLVLNQLSEETSIELLRNDENMGIGFALNKGIEKAIEDNFPWVMTFDQDSWPDKGLVKSITNRFDNDEFLADIGMLAPQVVDPDLDRYTPFLVKTRFFFRRVSCDRLPNAEVIAIITAGMLLRTDIFLEVGRFREDLFIDLVDTEYCLRNRSNGYFIARVCEAVVYHRLGEREERRFGPIVVRPTFHPPWRWYTINRNRLLVLKEYAPKELEWLLYELVAFAYTTIRMFLVEHGRVQKLYCILRGLLDGLRGLSGNPPENISKLV